GRIVAAGTANAATLDFGVARWNADGTLDTAFGCASPPCTGRTTVPILTRTDSAHALLVQPDGRIVVAGGAVDGSTGQNPTAIARLNADGTPDTAFGCSSPPCLGRNVIDYPGSVASTANAVARQPDGKLVVAGSSRPGSYLDFAVARFQSNGTLDPDFGCATPGTCSGRAQFDMAGFDDEAFAVAVLPDGRILVAGEAGAVADHYYDFAVIRLDANGTVDNTFGTAGRAFVDFGSVWPDTLYRDTAYAMHVQPDGAIVLAGRSQLSSGGANRLVVARLLADGSPDAGFGTAGKVIVATPDDAQARAVVGLADGRLLVAGHYLNGATRDIAVVALTAAGAPDATFGASGTSTIAAGARDDLAFSGALTGDEQVVVGARSNDLMTVVRLDTRGRATVSLAAAANPTLAGQPASFTATLSGGSGFTGAVAFLDGGAPIAGCAAVAVTGATAECTTSALAAGQHGIVARYFGDATRHDSSSATLSHSVGEVFTLMVAKDGNATGTVTSDPAGIACGATCAVTAGSGAVFTLTATPDANAVFAGWSGGGCSGAGTCVVTLDAAKAVTATFTLQPHELSVGKSGNGSGSVTSAPAGIDCGAACSASFDAGTLVTLTATAATGSTFTGWSGACTGTGACQVTMDGAKVVSAAFTLQRHALVLTKDGTGTGAVTSSPAGIDCGPDCEGEWDHGTVVTLTATADATSTFRQFDGDCVGAGPQCTVTMTAARAVTASFAIRQHALSVSVSGTGSGTVTSTPAGISCAGDCNEDYGHGTVVTLSAAPSADSVFAGWTGACAGTGECMVTMTDARSVTATFTLKQFTLTVAKQGAGSGAVTSSPAGIDCGADCAEAYDIGTAVVLTATPAPGSAFVGWSGSCAGTGACNVTMTSTRSVTASFAGAPVMGVLPGLVTFTPRQVGTTSAEQVIT
ncbi:MAG TPA: Ig-like domain repeat protein, partial [Usitatibacteraceae bacterium]|nr:Ig-like domain repeat protein [Usitatibacteraceae bacterium]